MRQLLAGISLVGVLFGSSLALAQPAPAPAPAAGEVRRDPAGVTGISPLHEAIAQGIKAVQDKNSDVAIQAFGEAVKIDGASMAARLMLAQTRMMRGELPGAREALEAAASSQGNDVAKANRLLLLGDVAEREGRGVKVDEKTTVDDRVKRWDKSAEAWTALSAAFPMLDAHRKTAEERKKQVAARQQREKDLEGVRARIRKGEDVPPPPGTK
ncbi:MAG: tetratricopeptide repeat protein [Polyangiaceae bacterium]|nr:tetratricopeptide repeat protein [Polyangiaceae bacterium]